MNYNRQIKTGKSGCGCGCGIFIFVLIIIMATVIPLVVSHFVTNEENATQIIEQIEEKFEGEEVEVSSEQKETINKLLQAIQTDNFEAFEKLASKNMKKYYEEDGIKMSVSEIFKSLSSDFKNRFGSDYTVSVEEYSGIKMDFVLLKGTAIGCIGVGKGNSGEGLFAFGVMLTEEKGEWKVLFAELTDNKETGGVDLTEPATSYAENTTQHSEPLTKNNSATSPSVKEDVKKAQKEIINIFFNSITSGSISEYEKTLTIAEKEHLTATDKTVEESYREFISDFKAQHGNITDIQVLTQENVSVPDELLEQVRTIYAQSSKNLTVDVYAVSCVCKFTDENKTTNSYIVNFILISENEQIGVFYYDAQSMSNLIDNASET